MVSRCVPNAHAYGRGAVFRLAGSRPDETGVHKTVAGNVRRGFSHAARNAAGRTYGRFRVGYGEMRLAIYARQRVRKHQRPALRGDQPLRRAAKTRAAREAVGKLSRLVVRRNGALATASFRLPQGRPPAPVADDTLQDGRGVRGGDRKQCKATRRRIRYGRVRRMRLSLDDASSGARRHAFIPQSAERRVSERHVRGRHGRVQTI